MSVFLNHLPLPVQFLDSATEARALQFLFFFWPDLLRLSLFIQAPAQDSIPGSTVPSPDDALASLLRPITGSPRSLTLPGPAKKAF